MVLSYVTKIRFSFFKLIELSVFIFKLSVYTINPLCIGNKGLNYKLFCMAAVAKRRIGTLPAATKGDPLCFLLVGEWQ